MVKITGPEPPLALLGRTAELATLTVTLDKAAAGSGWRRSGTPSDPT